MGKDNIIQLLHNNPRFVDFVRNNYSSMEFEIYGVPVVILKEDIGASFYYKIPFDSSYNYELIADFMRIAIPELQKLIEKEREKNLFL